MAPRQRYSPADNGATESEIDDEDQPSVWMIVAERHNAWQDIDDADDEEDNCHKKKIEGMAVHWCLRSCRHATPPVG
jgi:hypothetical protein